MFPPNRFPERRCCSSPGWTRTNNPPVNSRMLCQLSYRGSVPAAHCSGAQARAPDRLADLRERLLELLVRSRSASASSRCEPRSRRRSSSSLPVSLRRSPPRRRGVSSAISADELGLSSPPSTSGRAARRCSSLSKWSGPARRARHEIRVRGARPRAPRARALARVDQSRRDDAAAPSCVAPARGRLDLARQTEQVVREPPRLVPLGRVGGPRNVLDAQNACCLSRARVAARAARDARDTAGAREPLLESRGIVGRILPGGSATTRTSKPCATASSIPRSVASSPAASASKQRKSRCVSRSSSRSWCSVSAVPIDATTGSKPRLAQRDHVGVALDDERAVLFRDRPARAVSSPYRRSPCGRARPRASSRTCLQRVVVEELAAPGSRRSGRARR